MKKILLALAMLAFGLGSALADNPSDADQRTGNDPPKQTGGGGGGQEAKPGPKGNSGP